MLSNAYFLAKFRFDTAENEPAKKLQILNFGNFASRARSFAYLVECVDLVRDQAGSLHKIHLFRSTHVGNLFFLAHVREEWLCRVSEDSHLKP